MSSFPREVLFCGGKSLEFMRVGSLEAWDSFKITALCFKRLTGGGGSRRKRIDENVDYCRGWGMATWGFIKLSICSYVCLRLSIIKSWHL